MKESWRSYIEKAHQSLGEARAVARIELFEAAGRAAYLAAYHAAQALILARTDKIAKTHSGVRSEFARVAKEDPRIDRKLASFLAQAYNLKVIADYAVGSTFASAS
ncbi:HEPN domain-containing protein [Roseiarcus sp.]|uniref:HEPN domain-containing protein n=1 Tax=Roseiarcus sp. TaxID=1969460 RepID=UPI003C44BCB2